MSESSGRWGRSEPGVEGRSKKKSFVLVIVRLKLFVPVRSATKVKEQKCLRASRALQGDSYVYFV